MGCLVDSSTLISAERKKLTGLDFLSRIRKETDGEILLSAIAYTEIMTGFYRESDPHRTLRRKQFLRDIFAVMTVVPFDRQIADRAAKLSAEQSAYGLPVPFADLLIGATALHYDYSILTANPRHFELIPNLRVLRLSF